MLEGAASWVSRSTYRTAWAVCPWSGCQCSYSYGQGPAVGPHPSCRLGVRMGMCHEPLFGGLGDSKLIVSLSLGSSVTFKWKAKSCSDSEVSSCRLHHGDLLVMDGRCQDEYLHCTGPGLADKRMNITYRWVRYHIFSCPLAAGVLGSLPACAQGSSVLGPCFGDSSVPELVYLGLLVVLFCGLLTEFARLAFRRTGCGGPALLFWQFCPLGVKCCFWKVWPFCQQSWVCKGWTGRVDYPSEFFGFGDWLPCMLVWWGLLSLSGYDACCVIKLTRAPGEIRAKET